MNIEEDTANEIASDKAIEEAGEDFLKLDETKDIPSDWEMVATSRKDPDTINSDWVMLEKEKDKRRRGVSDKINASDKVLVEEFPSEMGTSLSESDFEKIDKQISKEKDNQDKQDKELEEGMDAKNTFAAFQPIGEAGLFVGAAGKAIKTTGRAEKADAKAGLIKGEKSFGEAKFEEKLGDASEMTGEFGEAVGDLLTFHWGNMIQHGKNMVKAGKRLGSSSAEVDKYRAYSKDSMEREDNAAGPNYKPLSQRDPSYQPSTKGVPLPPGTKLVNGGRYTVNKEAEKKEKEIQKLLNKEVESGPGLTDIAEATAKAIKLGGGPDYTKEAKTIFKTDEEIAKDRRVKRELDKKSLNTRPIDNRRRIDPIDGNVNYSASTMDLSDRLNRQYLRTNNISQRRKANTDNLPPSFDRNRMSIDRKIDRRTREFRNNKNNTVATNRRLGKDIPRKSVNQSKIGDLEESLRIISPGGIQTKNKERLPASNVANLIQQEYEISGELDLLSNRRIKNGIKKMRDTDAPPEKVFTDIAEKVIYTPKSQI